MSIQTTISMTNQVTPVLTSIIDSMNAVISSAQSVSDSTENMFQIDSGSIERARESIANATLALQEMTSGEEEFNNRARESRSIFEDLKKSVAQVVGVYVGLQGIKQFKDLSDSFAQIDAKLELIKTKDQEIEEIQNSIFRAAQNARAPYQEMANSVSKLGILAKDAFSGTEEIVLFTELLNKNFKLGGASIQEQTSAMHQLTQAMASGRLQGDEFSSIMENAPLLAQAIAETMGVSIGELKKMSSEGLITADIIKQALFDSADKINEKYEKLPKTFQDIKTSVINTFVKELKPALTQFNSFLNSQEFENFVSGVSSGAGVLASVIGTTVSFAITGFDLLYRTIDTVKYPLLGVIAIVGLYNSIMMIQSAIHAIKAGEIGSMTLAQSLYALATGRATLAQLGLNTALLASPIFWIPALIIGIVAILFSVIQTINKVKGTSISAIGIITGVVAWAATTLLNIAIGTMNAIIQAIWAMFVAPFVSIIEWVLNVANGGFDSFGDAVSNLIGNIISWFLSLGKIVTTIIDAIFGTDWTGGLSNLQTTVENWGKNEKAITIEREIPQISRLETREYFRKGSEWGQEKEAKLKEKFKPSTIEEQIDMKQVLENAMSDENMLQDNVSNIADNTKGIDEKLNKIDWENNNLMALKDLMETRAINDLSKEIKLEIHNQFTGDIAKEVDVNDLTKRISQKLLDDLDVAINAG